MMNEQLYMVGIVVDERATHGPEVQEVLTRYGSSILSRQGIPDPSRKRGLITVTMQTDEDNAAGLKDDLQAIEGVQSDYMALGAALQHDRL